MRIYAAEWNSKRIVAVHVGDYIRYVELREIARHLEEHDEILTKSDVVIFSGKMPSWYSLGLLAAILKKYQPSVIGIYRPPADKVLIVYSEDEHLPVNTWLELTKKLREFCRSGIIFLEDTPKHA